MSVHVEIISPIICEYIVLVKMCDREINFLTHHVGMMSLLQHKVIKSIIGNLREHNNTI